MDSFTVTVLSCVLIGTISVVDTDVEEGTVVVVVVLVLVDVVVVGVVG